MDIFPFVFFVMQASVACGRLTVLRGKEQLWKYTHGSRKLLCVSEDDGGSLIWNSNLNWLYSSYEFTDRQNVDFQPLNAYQRGEIDCDLTSDDKCMLEWNTFGWSLTNSKRTPMGPVFDRRWEGFREYSNFYMVNQYRFMEELWKSGAFAVSIRGSTDAHMLFCETKGYETDFCYWIIIGGWSNAESTIRKCENGVPSPPTPPLNETTCAQKRASYFHKPLSSTEWRTFVVTWDKSTRNISVYDTNKLLLTYVDNEKQSPNSSLTYNLFVRSSSTMLFRFHLYAFLHTTNSKTTLESPVLYPSNVNLCVEMIIGLCTDCQMRIVLVNPFTENEKTLEVIRGSTVATAHRLPMWQYVQINKTVPSEFRKLVKLKLIPEIDTENTNPLWAIANVRKCPPTGSIRYAVMEAMQDYANDYFWPNVTCQKLFYNENAVVNSASDVATNLEFDDLYCSEGKVGPYCSVSCKNQLGNDADCRETVICETMGCTCPAGFIGNNCQSRCGIGQYGYDCKQTCGWCKADNCNFKMGVCMSGCDNSKRYNIPPFCKIGIDVLPSPDIDFINETVVRVILPVKEEYKLIPSSYLFIIQKEGMGNNHPMGDYAKIFQNTTTLIGYADDLVPGTAYKVSCTLHLMDDSVNISGKWNNFMTRCTPTTHFDVEIRNTSLTLKKSREVNTLYSCPDKWYDLTFENRKTGVEISKGSLTKLPYEFMQLTPYTNYKITISKGAAVLFSREVRTLDGAPSKVRNFVFVLTSKRELKLKWDPPQYMNGIINNYKVVLQIKEYFGCSNLKMASPKNVISLFTAFTNITLLDLAPYARYVAKISAYTSYPGPEKQKIFTTNQTEIPTAVYSNVRIQNYTLMWDPPQDCTTISGPIIARVVVKGVSKSVANFTVPKQTANYYINLSNILHGAETYEARIYTIRDYNKQPNETLYQKFIFTTPPKAPPPVRDLEIFEIDSRAMNVHLRWQEPQSPTNGEIQYYIVSNCDFSCKILLKVSPVEYCNLWNKYTCAIVKQSDRLFGQIMVSAVNVNVSTPGSALSVPIVQENVRPEAPQIFTVKILEKGIVNLSWSHPWRTGGHLEKFSITAELMSSNLRMQIQQSQRSTIHEHPVKEYRLQYNEQLRLLSSSTYKISICGVTNMNEYGEGKIAHVETPLAMAFEKELVTEVSNADSTISLHIPAVLNDTRNSLTHVVVKESQPCNHSMNLSPLLREKAGIKNDERVWLVATFPTNTFANKTFIVGDKKLYGDATNCPLKPGEPYVIMVIVQTEGGSIDDQIMVAKTTSIRISEIPKRHEAWIIPVMISVIVVAVVFYFYRRKKRGSVKEIVFCEEMASALESENIQEKTILSNSKQTPPTTSDLADKETLSQMSTPYGSNAILMNDVKPREEGTSLVKVNDFEDYVKRAISSGLLDTQFSTLPRGQTKPWEYGRLPQNKFKNRYADLTAYDENRVVLKKLPDDPYSDYINANYIKGYKKEKCYIATQGPKANTVIDFWRMIWQEEAHIICMVVNTVEGGKAKCEQYWPDIGKKKRYGEVVVFNAKHNVCADYTFRTLYVTYEDEMRKIEHLHYTAWPDHGVPLYTHSVVSYLKKLLATSPGNGPVVVHCSAGVGRTGTIILCDVCLRRAAAEGAVDVFAEAKAIRSQRVNMVDTKQQYLIVHLVLVECLLSVPTSVPCTEVLESKIKELKKQLPIQKQSLEKTAWQDEALRPPTSQMSLSECNLAKNRFPELVSAKVSRVYLKRYPPTDEDSDYISAVYVDGVRLQNQYLATQLPLPATFSDFWRMVAEFKVELIILLQPPDPEDPTCCPIVPCDEFKPVPYMNIKTKEFVEFEYYTSQKLILVNKMEKPVTEQQVIILCSTEWKAGRNQDPPEMMALMTLWQAAERIPRGDGPTAVLCYDGVTGCGLYLALSFLLERMSVEKECDVCLAIRAIRRSRPDFVQSLKQMEYLYDTAITYLKYFETYANFT